MKGFRSQVSYETLAFLAIEILLVAVSSVIAFCYLFPMIDAHYSKTNELVQRSLIFYMDQL